jgi:hypothetical protein
MTPNNPVGSRSYVALLRFFNLKKLVWWSNMRAIQIDAGARTVAAAEYSGDFNEIYELIDTRATFEVAGIENGDGIYVDGEGLINAEHFFEDRNYNRAF